MTDTNDQPKPANESKLSDLDKKKLLKEKYLKDLNENPKYQQYFEQFNSVSVKNFKERYSEGKANIEIYSGLYNGLIEKQSTRYSDFAFRKLWEIQQRKLFELQCRWRAEEIKIPGVEICADFESWKEMITDCTFLPPITEEEYNRYIQFIQNSTYEDIVDWYWGSEDWQNYEELKNYHFNGDESFDPPAWYEFYENRTGQISIYYLPDIRGEKEEKYLKASRDNRMEKFKEAEKNKPKVEIDRRPSIEYYRSEDLEKFINTFEEYKFQYAYSCQERYREIDDDRDLEEAIETLKFADRKVYIESGHEWRESIIKTAGNYNKQKLLEAFPGVYKNYLFRVKNGLAFDSIKLHRSKPTYIADAVRGMILEGRELLGEPRDFNF